MHRFIVVLIHLAYWSIYAFLFAFAVFAYTIDTLDKNGVPLAYSINGEHIGYMLLLFFLPSLMAFYTVYFVLFPRYFQQKKILLLIVTGALTIIAALCLALFIVFLLTGIWPIGTIAPGLVLIMGIIPGVHALMGVVLRGFITSYGDIRIKQELKRKNLETELDLVKARINPHFLFNTINNIDVLIRKDADKASDYLNKLSDILRYMLYETKAEKVPFDKEVLHIEKYLELQKIRSSNPNYIRFSKNGTAVPLVAPMLFMPFIENAVKHAENKKAEKAIVIHFDVSPDRVIFECSNAYTGNRTGKKTEGGLGQDLARKRLDLLYPGNYHLDIDNRAGVYSVKLVLLLSDEKRGF